MKDLHSYLGKSLLVFLILITLILPMTKKAEASNPLMGATELTQLLNNVELIGILGKEALHLQETIKQYQVMLQNLEKLPHFMETNAMNALMSLANSTQVGMGLTYANGNIGSQLQDVYKDFDSYKIFLENADPDDRAEAFQKILETTYDTVEGALESANLQMSQFQDETTALEAMQQQMKTAVGQNQILQAAGSIAAAQVEQMQKLRQLVMAQGNLQAQQAAVAADVRAYEKAGREKALDDDHLNFDPDNVPKKTAADFWNLMQ